MSLLIFGIKWDRVRLSWWKVRTVVFPVREEREGPKLIAFGEAQ